MGATQGRGSTRGKRGGKLTQRGWYGLARRAWEQTTGQPSMWGHRSKRGGHSEDRHRLNRGIYVARVGGQGDEEGSVD